MAPDGWHLPGYSTTYSISHLDESEDYNKIYYKERWTKEELSTKKVKEGARPLEQHLIVSFSLKYCAISAKYVEDT